MTYFAYIHPSCRGDSKEHARLTQVEGLATKVEQDQRAAVFDRFLPSPFLKKVVGRDFRLVAYEWRQGEDTLICFLRLFSRGAREYDEFVKKVVDEPSFGERFLDGLLSESELAAELEERLGIEENRLAVMLESADEQLVVERRQIQRLQALAEFQENRVQSMRVTAGVPGVGGETKTGGPCGSTFEAPWFPTLFHRGTRCCPVVCRIEGYSGGW